MIITRGLTEIYDILTHITFLNIESQKIFERIGDKSGGINQEWLELEKVVVQGDKLLNGAELDQAIWNVSIILGRTYKETRETYEHIEINKKEGNHNSGFFQIIYDLGQRILLEQNVEEEQLTIYFTPSLHEMIGHHQYASSWAETIKRNMYEKGLHERPVHIISANMHSVKNLLYGFAALKAQKKS